MIFAPPANVAEMPPTITLQVKTDGSIAYSACKADGTALIVPGQEDITGLVRKLPEIVRKVGNSVK